MNCNTTHYRANSSSVPGDPTLVAALCAGLIAGFGNPLGGGRSFYAFGQHYALNVWAIGNLDVDPWTNWETICRTDFGDANTIAQALHNNPRAFAWHLGRNLRHLPHNLIAVADANLELAYGSQNFLHVCLILFSAVGIVGLILRLVRPSLANDPANRSLRIALGMLFFAVAPPIASLLVVYPRLHYLIPLVTFSGALAFAGYLGFPRLVARLRWMEAWPTVVAFVALLILVTPNRAHKWSIQQRIRPQWEPAAAPLDIQRTAATLRGLHVRTVRQINVLESDYSRAFYAGWDVNKVDHWTKAEGFWKFLSLHEISVIVLNDRLMTDVHFRDDPDFQRFVEEKKVGRFHFFAVPDTAVRVAVREDLLPDASPKFAVVMNLLHDREGEANRVVKIYQRYLHRTPSNSDIDYWVDIMEHGATDKHVLASILSSPEFCGFFGNDKNAWVQALYRELIGRAADAADESRGLQQLADGVPMSQVALALMTTQAYESNLVQHFFQQYLGRTATAGEIAYWVEDMELGASEGQVLAGIIGTPDFYSRSGATDKAWVNAVYLILFNRNATEEEERRWSR